jgi:citrate synthase
MVDGLPAAGERADGAAGETASDDAAAGAGEAPADDAAAGAGGAIAARLWTRLHPAPPTRARLRALDAALVVLADHELALSALAARVAASAHADPYLVVLAGLCAQGGALHGAAGTAVERFLAAIPDAAAVPAALGDRLAAGEPLPGFGHAVYRGRDPRADALLDLLAEAGPDPARHAVLEAVLQTAGRHAGPAPNVDLALGALTDCLHLVPGSAEAIFAIARTAGLIAHALEEYPYRLRFRARAAYSGPAP